jgi:hypothetical protein
LNEWKAKVLGFCFLKILSLSLTHDGASSLVVSSCVNTLNDSSILLLLPTWISVVIALQEACFSFH